MYAKKKVSVSDLGNALQENSIIFVENGEYQAQRHDVIIKTARETGIPVVVSSVWSANHLSNMYPELIIYPLDIDVLGRLNHKTYLLNDISKSGYLDLREAVSSGVGLSGFVKE